MMVTKDDGKNIDIVNLSELEDTSKALEVLGQIVAMAGKSAAIEAKVAGLTQVFTRGNRLVRKYPDGKEEFITDSTEEGFVYYIPYKTATILHAKK